MPPRKSKLEIENTQSEDFQLLAQAIEELKSSQESTIKPKCVHVNLIEEKGVEICIDCGSEVDSTILNREDWPVHNDNNKNINDISRIHIRKTDERTIYKDVENLGLSESIVSKANKLYTEVVKGKIYRGNFRRSIIFACVFHAFKISKNPQSHDRLIEMFNISRKMGLKGLKFVNLNAPKTSLIRITYITPVDLVGDIMDNFSATEEQKKEVINIYEKVRDKSQKLNRSRPMSYSAGIVFYWICLKKKPITLKEFSKKVTLSELTINRIAKEISSLIGKEEIKLPSNEF